MNFWQDKNSHHEYCLVRLQPQLANSPFTRPQCVSPEIPSIDGHDSSNHLSNKLPGSSNEEVVIKPGNKKPTR